MILSLEWIFSLKACPIIQAETFEQICHGFNICYHVYFIRRKYSSKEIFEGISHGVNLVIEGSDDLILLLHIITDEIFQIWLMVKVYHMYKKWFCIEV